MLKCAIVGSECVRTEGGSAVNNQRGVLPLVCVMLGAVVLLGVFFLNDVFSKKIAKTVTSWYLWRG